MFKEATRSELFVMDTKKQLPFHVNKPIISPLHYGETIEITFVRGIEGETIINGKRFTYKEKNVFFIPPKHLHTSVYQKGGERETDMICAFHINVQELEKIINLQHLLQKDSHSLFDLAFRCDDFDGLFHTVQMILDENRTFLERSIDLLSLLNAIIREKTTDDSIVQYSKIASHLIAFVEANYTQKLTLQNAATHFGYSKQYFCKWFKKETGITFHDFYNAVRIQHARTHLANGYSVEEAAQSCGFEDPSYFTKVFKRFVGIPPKVYSLNKDKL